MYTGTLIEFLNMGGGEIMLILVVVLLLFGGKKLPELARGLGKGLRDFKDASEGVKREIHRNINSVGITDEINEFKSALTGDENNRPQNYDYKPGEPSHNNDVGSDYNDEAAHHNSTENMDTTHAANVDHTTNANAGNIESADHAEQASHAELNDHKKIETDKN